MKIKTNIPNIQFFFDFSNPLKQIKIDLLALKTLLKTYIKTLEKIIIFALKNLLKTALMWGTYNPHKILPVGWQKGQK